ncbi:MAG: hypothetical protein M4579_006370 [Chaenotheca gracillima]|nr:MAG: hypothetical protein M4579_006370 [Chaenotheca gracillima]
MSSRPEDRETESSLGDSHYEHINESDFQTSDEDELDDAAVSVSTRGLDDMSSVSDLNDITSTSSQADTQGTASDDGEDDVVNATGHNEHSDHEEDESDHDEGDEPSHTAEIEDSSESQEVNGSGITITGEPVHPSATLYEPLIEFKEPSFWADQVAVTHTIRSFGPRDAPPVLLETGWLQSFDRIALTVRQTMSKESLALEEPFRVLYHGDSRGKERIMDKVARSLAVPVLETAKTPHARQRRFNVVPVSDFYGKQTPEVTLVPSSGINLCFDECTDAKGGQNAYSDLSMLINNEFWYSSFGNPLSAGHHSLSRSDWKLPHIAILFSTEHDDAPALENRERVKLFMARHSVPNITICEDSFLEGHMGYPEQDAPGLHMCLESRSLIRPTHTIIRRMPIDLATFESIDERQMNRNFAYLTGLYPGRSVAGQMTSFSPESPTDAQRYQGSDIEALIRTGFIRTPKISWDKLYIPRTRRAISWISLTALLILLLPQLFSHLYEFSYPSRRTLGMGNYPHGDDAACKSTGMVFETPAPSAATSPPTVRAKPSTTASKQTPERVVENSKLDPFGIDAGNPIDFTNESNDFKLQLVGCCHLIMKPPRRITAVKKAPTIFVQMSREDTMIDTALTKLFDGVYEISLTPEDAYDGLIVRVWTTSKPVFDQTFYLEFGIPSSKFLGWKSRAKIFSKQFKKNAHTTVAKILKEAGKELEILVHETRTAATATRHEAQKFREFSLRRTESTRHRFTTRVQALSKEASILGANWSKELALRSHAVSTVVYNRTLELYKARASRPPLKEWLDLSRFRESPSLSLLTYQRKARDIWRTTLKTIEQARVEKLQQLKARHANKPCRNGKK